MYVNNVGNLSELEDSAPLFEDQDSQDVGVRASIAAAPCRGCEENKILLQQILQELRELRKITSKPTLRESAATFSVEKSSLEKPLTEYIKQRFRTYPFIQDTDEELLMKIKGLSTSFPNKEVVKSACKKYCSRKMVDFRSQTKAKLLSKEGVDPAEMSLGGLENYLFKKFGEARRLTMCLRCYCHEQRLWRRPAGSQRTKDLDFWGGFRVFMERVISKEESGKWERMKTREEGRIERYVNVSA
ncbi:uncharacterized protein LOC117319117 isoform X2 [Pecten maximus]|uniref:uncharacterized protein LOC117319117 isoform X2 n=1 Tax=Pecten maximus TaxID=6579 RepID=UPI0014580F31|nr:uncharacterized protein LOC117319117 isoform X2 [Pecten maximus]